MEEKRVELLQLWCKHKGLPLSDSPFNFKLKFIYIMNNDILVKTVPPREGPREGNFKIPLPLLRLC